MASLKTPIIHRSEKIYPAITGLYKFGENQERNARPIGEIMFKMRLRKPISEVMRVHRERTEIANMTKAAAINPQGSLKPAMKLVTINILKAHKLKIPMASTNEAAPFFCYQFYTFDERYSHNGVGLNPTYDDTFSYKVLFDANAHTYFEKECLEVILFDDNAPIQGQGLDDRAT